MVMGQKKFLKRKIQDCLKHFNDYQYVVSPAIN